MSATVDRKFFLLAIESIQIMWALMAAELFLYGAYVIMFAFYMHVSRARNMAKTHRFLHISTITLFILAIAHCALQLAITVIFTRAFTAGSLEDLFHPSPAFVRLIEAGNAVYVTSTVIADSIFIFRCYSIWNRRLAVIVFPAFLVLATTGFGYANVILTILIDSSRNVSTSRIRDEATVGTNLFIASITVSVFATVVLMGLTVGRIWSLARAARVVMGRKTVGTYHTACAMILESGALYCVGGIAFVAVGFRLAALPGGFTGAILAQIVGIAPTLISVRVALGCSVENVNSFVVQPCAGRSSLATKTEAPTPESLDDRVLYIHATEHKAAA
ncbi:hypothetical protein B0H16DRAFT_1878475 [Mycena metata]|uniref:Uncharacterized protein n=1 Tax=Mycena metata TaxID=1033252 RepID=A0AAD7K795_9AGAR|nr:hypothetical protein B0H16DRAFT_1878475 [Mycena metata]